MKNKFRNPYEEKKPKKVGRLAQLSKANRKAKNMPPVAMRSSEMDWQYEKRYSMAGSLLH